MRAHIISAPHAMSLTGGACRSRIVRSRLKYGDVLSEVRFSSVARRIEGELMKKHRLGAWGEDVTEKYLQSKGYEILARNWRSPEGEIDLVAWDGDTFVFVEVKTRSSNVFGTPEESLTQRKRKRLQLAGLAYLDSIQSFDSNWRIDVVAIEVGSSGAVQRFDHYEDAIDGGVEL